MENKQSSLKEVVNAPELVQAFGKTYEIRKFTLGPMTQAFEYIGPMGYLIRRMRELPQDETGRIQADGDAMLDLAVTAISISGPSVMGLISIATKEPLEWLEGQDPLDGLKIFAKVVEKNLDFFSQENMDRLKAMFDNFQQRIPMPGGGSSTT